MADFPLFCKSYHQDVLRVKRMVDSVEACNTDNLPVFISVPSNDRQLFLNHVGSGRCEWLSDEDIVAANPALSWDKLQQIDPGKTQQIIKSEFWRLHQCDAYLCLDSDSVFIRKFQTADFVASDGVPYTTMHQSKELLQQAINVGRPKMVKNFRQDSAHAKSIFNRNGPDYDFGPTPVIWASRVWQDLAAHYLAPRGMSFMDAINQHPSEIRWYGEALLAYQGIPLHPIEPIFRVYHTDWQYFAQRKMGETLEKLQENYLGVVMQSNWHYEMDFSNTGKSVLSGVARKIKRQIKRLF